MGVGWKTHGPRDPQVTTPKDTFKVHRGVGRDSCVDWEGTVVRGLPADPSSLFFLVKRSGRELSQIR